MDKDSFTEDVEQALYQLNDAFVKRQLGKVEAIHVSRDAGKMFLREFQHRYSLNDVSSYTVLVPGQREPFQEIQLIGIKIRWPVINIAMKDGSFRYG